MSKGLSKQQVLVLGLLRGTEPLAMEYNEEFQPHSWKDEPIKLTTKGLLLEFEDRGFRIGNEKWKQWQFKMRRACDSLVRRGLVEAYYDTVEGHHTIVWQAVKVPDPAQPA
jgi:hypothetical protein